MVLRSGDDNVCSGFAPDGNPIVAPNMVGSGLGLGGGVIVWVPRAMDPSADPAQPPPKIIVRVLLPRIPLSGVFPSPQDAVNATQQIADVVRILSDAEAQQQLIERVGCKFWGNEAGLSARDFHAGGNIVKDILGEQFEAANYDEERFRVFQFAQVAEVDNRLFSVVMSRTQQRRNSMSQAECSVAQNTIQNIYGAQVSINKERKKSGASFLPRVNVLLLKGPPTHQ
jgi:hypothetical protein